MRSLVARAPTRIDFGGGWTDVPPYSEREGGRVCSVAIASHATIRLRRVNDTTRGAPNVASVRIPDQRLLEVALTRSGVRDVGIELRSDFPIGAGLGGSSATGVAIAGALAAWRGEALDKTALAERSRATEIDGLQVPGGRQDHSAQPHACDNSPSPLSPARRSSAAASWRTPGSLA